MKYPHLAVGVTIRFRVRGTEETRNVKVPRVTEYPTFEALLDGEGPANVNPVTVEHGPGAFEPPHRLPSA